MTSRKNAENWLFTSLFFSSRIVIESHWENLQSRSSVLQRTQTTFNFRQLAAIDLLASASKMASNASMGPSKTFRNNHVQRKCRNWNSAWVSNRLMISDGNSDGKNWIENRLNGALVGEKFYFQNDIWYFVDDKKTKSNSFLRSVTNDFKVAAREQWIGR